MHVDLRDPIFKACTRVAMLGGVPLVPLVLVVGAFLMGGSWVFLLSPAVGLGVIACAVPVVMAMRHASRQDDQRLAQRLLWLKLRLRQRANATTRRAHVYTAQRRSRR